MAKTIKQSAPVLKSKFGKALGYRTPDFFKGRTFASGAKGSFTPSGFKMTQHKGSS